MENRCDRLVSSMTVGPRLSPGFALIVGLMLGMAVIAVAGLQALNGQRFIAERVVGAGGDGGDRIDWTEFR